MTIRTILFHPEPRLRKACEPVPAVDEGIRALVSDMFETMYDAPGIGLAAPQIGVLKRVVTIDTSKDEEDRQPMVFINPELVWESEETSVYEEGCLSIPDEFEEVTRPAQVRVQFLDLDGEAQELECDGLLATCIQHEIDHLNGKLFIDYLGPVKRQMITGRMKKRKKQRAADAATERAATERA